MRIFSLMIIVLLFGSKIQAQSKLFTLGYLKDSITKEAVPFVAVTNMNTKKTVMSNASGRFKIEVKENQVLSFAAVGYHFDTILVTNRVLLLDTFFFQLHPLTKNLTDVTVTSKTKFSAYQLDSIQRRKQYFGTRSDHKLSTISYANSGVGIGVNLDKFYSKSEKQRMKFIDFYYDLEKQEYIHYRFSPQLVSNLTGLKDEALLLFMQKYRPSYQWLRAHTTDEDIMYYINDKLKEINKNK
ncbi:MAG: hypothetical protein ACOVNY_09520 [Chitinophagaceae bacterium]